jgi:hypothetical protein
MEGAVLSRFLRAVANAGAKHLALATCWKISVGPAFTAFPTVSTGD